MSGSGRHDGGWGKLWVDVLVVSDLFAIFIMLLSFVYLYFLFFVQFLQCTFLLQITCRRCVLNFYDSPFPLWLCRGILVEY